MTEQIKLTDINTTGGTQARAGLDRDTITEYADALRRGDQFPAIDLYYDGQVYWLADGFHRVAAKREAEGSSSTILANIHQGTAREAVLHAVGANDTHGLRRSNDDKRRAVLRLLNDSEWGKWSDRGISRRCKVSHPFVAKIREETGNVTSERVYTDRHGNETVMDTANIGQSEDIDEADLKTRLRQSLRENAFSQHKISGLDDDGIKTILSREWGGGGGSIGPGRMGIFHKGGADPKFFYNNIGGRGKPTLRGKALINAVRDLMEIPYPQPEAAVPCPQPKPLMPELAYDWLRNYKDERSRTWRDLSPNQVHHRNAPCYQAFIEKFPGLTDPKLYLKQALARLKRESETAVSQPLDREDDNYSYADELQKQIEAAETAVSQPKPMVDQVLEEVEHYEKEMETAVSGTSILGSLKSTEWLIEEMMLQAKAPSPLFFALNKVVMAVRDAMDVASKFEETAVSREVSA